MKATRERFYDNPDPNLKIFVQNWIDKFYEREGLWRVFSKVEREAEAVGGRREANIRHINYL